MTIAYFGCWDRSGHYLWRPDHQTCNYDDEKALPTPAQLDGSKLFLPHPEVVGRGAITYLPAMNLTVLAWWGNPWDTRGAVNSAVIVSGNVQSLDAIWGAFEKFFPGLASKLSRPVL